MPMKEDDMLELVEEFLTLPEEDRPTVIEALQILEKYKVIDPPISHLLILN